MNWIKSNWVPLAVGAALGYYIAKNGGVKGAVGGVTSKARSVAS